MDKNKIIVFDTTLRDGEQSPGCSMNTEEKIRVALQLEKLGVDVIEAGFAAASPGDFDAVSRIAEVIKKSSICSLSRAVEMILSKLDWLFVKHQNIESILLLQQVQFICNIN